MSVYLKSEGYKRFRGWVAQQKISVDLGSDKYWKYYDYGPKDVAPLVFLPGVAGTAEVFYMQFLSLCPKGFRLISAQHPDYFSHEDFCKGFERFLDKIGVSKIHLFGTSIGGYMAQCFIQYKPDRVLSLILNNAFSDTSYYKENAPCVPAFPVMPDFMLKRIILSNFPEYKMESEIANSVDFMVEMLETLSGKDIASRLTLNCSICPFLKPSEMTFDKRKITIIDTIDEVSIPEKLREEVYKFYPDAKIAEMKTGGNFPYLSRPDEMSMLIQVHLRRVSDEKQFEDSQNNENEKDTKEEKGDMQIKEEKEATQTKEEKSSPVQDGKAEE